MRKSDFKRVSIGPSTVEMKRSEGGVVHIKAEDVRGAQRGLGFAHAQDRLMQILFTRVVAKGKITEFLFDSDQAYAIDIMIRKLGLEHDIAFDIKNLSDEAKEWCSAYGEGINSYLDKHGPPKLCKMLKIPLDPWSIEDSMLMIKMLMYLGLAQGQERCERFILQAIHDGVNVELLKKLFSPYLDTLDAEAIEILRSFKLEAPYLDFTQSFQPALSNNWVISGEKSYSGKPLCATDPHLQVNRLPAIWYEVILECGQNFQMGITTPGFPGLIMGRSLHLFASFTYGMMDVIDLFIEDVRDGKCRREENFAPIRVRNETIKRKKKGEITHYFFETSTGVLERKDSTKAKLEDGRYTSLAWSCGKEGTSPVLNALVKLWSATTVEEAGKIVREVTIPSNWVLADTHGGIAYQQAGRLPQRKKAGLFPLAAWKEENLWQGFVASDQLSSEYNPKKGFAASANDDKNTAGKPVSITIPYSNYRYERIHTFLEQNKKFTSADMRELQCDVYSLQGEKYLEQIRDLIPETPVGRLLRDWDCRYTKDSKGATLFEAFYFDLLSDVFGKLFGEESWKAILHRKGLLVFTHGYFDRVLLSGDPAWFGKEGKQECLRRVVARTLDRFSVDKIPPWGVENGFTMTNLFLDGNLPKFLGFDVGPLKIAGNRATVAASFVFSERKRIFAAAASYRMVTDLNTVEADTVLAGGVSENRFSKYYKSDISKWVNFEYKKITL